MKTAAANGKVLKQDSVGFLIADLSRLMRAAFQQQLEGSSLTPAQARALIHIARHEGVRQVELAQLLDLQPITLARLIDRLAQTGLVERRADPADRRAYRIYLTSLAGSHLLAIQQVAARIRKQALHGVGEQQALAVMSGLRKMRDNLSAS